MTRRLSIPRPAAHGSSPRRRGGFSMIELLIVITVIAILAGLLLGGVQSAMGRVRVTAAVAEIKNLEKAIKDFNAEFGTDPPSFIVLYESTTTDTNGWNTANTDTRYSRAFIRQLWKDFQFGSAATPVNVDINGDGDTTDTLRLNGAECLVFFLGGLIDKSSGVAVPKGFSKVSASPFGSVAGPWAPVPGLITTLSIPSSSSISMAMECSSTWIPFQGSRSRFSISVATGERVIGL